MSFYTDLFKAEGCDVDAAAAELLQGPPQLGLAEHDSLGSDITLEKLTSTVMAYSKAGQFTCRLFKTLLEYFRT